MMRGVLHVPLARKKQGKDLTTMFRQMVERLSRNKILRRRLPPPFGSVTLYVSPDAQLKYLKPNFDDDLLKIVSSYVRDDSIIWDIGANVGVFALAAASVATKGYVLAIEPDMWLANVIRKSLTLTANLNLPVHVLSAAVSDMNGAATFLIARRGRASNALESVGGRSQMGGIRHKVLVPTLTVDTLLDYCPPPTFVKIDVEGAELLVLKGGARLLSEFRPMIYIEVGKSVASSIANVFRQNRYLLFDGSAPCSESQQLSECAFNTLAIPEEQFA